MFHVLPPCGTLGGSPAPEPPPGRAELLPGGAVGRTVAASSPGLAGPAEGRDDSVESRGVLEGWDMVDMMG